MTRMTSNAVPTRLLAVVISTVLLMMTLVFIAARATAGAPTPTTSVVYIATGENFPDALGVGPASALARGPILLVTKTSVPAPTRNEIIRLNPDRIVIVGGTAVISPAVETELSSLATVTRIAGNNRYETAALVSEAAFPSPPLITVGVADAEQASEWTAVDSNTAKLETTISVTQPGMIMATGGVWIFKNTFTNQCWIAWTLRPLVGGVMRGSDRGIEEVGHNGYQLCATNGHVAVTEPGTYTISLLADVGGGKVATDLADGSLEVMFIPSS